MSPIKLEEVDESSQLSQEPEQSKEVKPEKRIVLIRHAESEWNARGSQEKNCVLTEFGKNSCSHLKFDADLVICSNMRRARETLDHSNIVYKDVIFTDLCREFLDDNPVNFYNGEEIFPETWNDLQTRINEFKDMLRHLQQSYDTICVITHYIFLEKMTGYQFKNCFYMNYSIGDL